MESLKDDNDNDGNDEQIEGDPGFEDNNERRGLHPSRHQHTSSISEVFVPDKSASLEADISAQSVAYSPIQIFPAHPQIAPDSPTHSQQPLPSPIQVPPAHVADSSHDQSPHTPHSPSAHPLLSDSADGLPSPSIPSDPSSYIIHVRTVTGKTVNLTVRPTDSVASVKAQLSVTPGIEVPVEQQRLIYSGRELDDGRTLSLPPNPILSECTIHVVLRVRSPRQMQMQMQMPFGGHVVGPDAAFPEPSFHVRVIGSENAGDMHHVIGIAPRVPPAAMDTHLVSLNVERSSMNIRGVGTTFLVVGGVDLVLGSGDAEWGAIVLAVMLILLGGMAINAGVARTTASAKRYLGGILVYILAFIVIEFVELFTRNNDTGTNVAAAVFVSIILPIALCSICVYCARMHVRNCQERDTVLSLSVRRGTPIGPRGIASITRAHHIQ